MTKKEINDYNRRCAEFLDGKYIIDERLSFEPKGRWYIPHFPDAQQNYNLKFHSDWNWIMKVVEAIEKLGYKFILSWNITVLISLVPNTPSKIALIEGENRKEAVVQAINQFLIWYNE